MLPRRPAGGAPALPEVSGRALRPPGAGAQGVEAGVGPAGRRRVAAGGRPGRRRGAARGAGRARARRARGRRLGSERRRAGRCGPIGDAPRRAAELLRPDLAAPEAGVSERGREPWLRASPPPPLLTRHNPRGARGARRNRWAAARSGRRSCRRRAGSVGAEDDASTKAGTAPARGGGRRGRPLRARPAPAASLRALPWVPGRRRRRTVLRPRSSGRRSQELHATRSGAPAASFPAARGPAESTRARVPTSTTAGPPARARPRPLSPDPQMCGVHGELEKRRFNSEFGK
ncbi:translation initiation factor IF-2-like [Eptesicus fuscus]|uniref:translation initiation factor IF-2-like n=1 Tax=Eptesicus fuscus TaxID=29078 RepID=UPI002404204E|nr:translation initiation factor IF-2-like [Eptesicus fuscus]